MLFAVEILRIKNSVTQIIVRLIRRLSAIKKLLRRAVVHPKKVFPLSRKIWKSFRGTIILYTNQRVKNLFHKIKDSLQAKLIWREKIYRNCQIMVRRRKWRWRYIPFKEYPRRQFLFSAETIPKVEVVSAEYQCQHFVTTPDSSIAKLYSYLNP